MAQRHVRFSVRSARDMVHIVWCGHLSPAVSIGFLNAGVHPEQDAVWHVTFWLPETLWPSGLRRWLKAPFRKGVGSNPTGVTFPVLVRQLAASDCKRDAVLGFLPKRILASVA